MLLTVAALNHCRRFLRSLVVLLVCAAGHLAHGRLPSITAIGPDAVADGLPLDAAWPLAEPIDAFVQVMPRPGAAPSRRTELRMAHDGRTLYVSIRADDPEPRRIVSQQMRRDVEWIRSDDHVALVIDVEGRGRNGYLFVVNPNGTQYDALIYDGGQERADWDALWHSQARIEKNGWRAELAIPLSALGVRADPGEAASWRINAERWMPAAAERVRLAGLRADQEVYSLSDALPLPAIRPERNGWGLRLKPSLRWTRASAAASPTGRTRQRLEPGLEVFHQSESGLRTAAAFNLDFGEAEADERTVNLTRFELFRPEKREFFVRDAGRFSFGGLNEWSAIPFYSRRVGLDGSGRARSLDAGLKFAGSLADIDVGVFAARVSGGATAPGEPDTPEADVGVLRVSRAIGERQRLGLIATSGNPEGTAGSDLLGVDHQFRDSRWASDKTLETHLWMQQSRNEGLGRGNAYGGQIDYPNLGFTGLLAWRRIDDTFNPALGYLAERGVTAVESEVGWWHRTAEGGNLIPRLDWNMRRRHDRTERSTVLNPELWIENAAGDYILPEWFFETDEVANAYEPAPGLTITPGRHRWNYFYLLTETSKARPFSAGAEFRTGGYYDGQRNDQEVSLGWNPGPSWAASVKSGRADLRLPGGRFIVRTGSLRLDHTPTNRLASSLLLQWDNVSNELGGSLRVRWTLGLGRELLFAVDRLGYTGERRRIETRQTTALVKLVWNFER